MRQLLIFIPIAIFSFCSTHRKTESKIVARDTTIALIDSLGKVSINIPYQTDTFLTWIRRNDCGYDCEEGKYRFQPKNFPIFKESGFFWLGQPEDSVYQLTISHERPQFLTNNQDSFAFKLKGHFRENLMSDAETMNIIGDSILMISDRYYAVFKISDFNEKIGVHVKRLIAFSSIRGNEIIFRYDLLTKKTDTAFNDFYNKALENLQSVRIHDGG